MVNKFMIIIILVVLIPFEASALSVKASVDKNQLTEDDSLLVLTVSISGGNAEIDTSVIKDFQVVSHSTGSSFKWINGQSSSEYNHIFTLIPLKKGRIAIPPLPVMANGKTVYTDAISINAGKNSMAQGLSSQSDIFVKASVSDDSPYPGQSIIYSFKFYYSVQISSPSLKLPEFKNFNAKENDKDVSTSTLIDGREYQVIERKVILIPVKPGVTTLSPSILSFQMAVANRRNSRDTFESLFNDPFFNRASLVKKTLKTEPLTIKVLPLPHNPYPEPFSGLIGSFRLKSNIQSRRIKAGESTTLSLDIEGQGNLMDAAEPSLVVPPGLKMYKDSPIDHITLDHDGYSGTRTFRMAFVGVDAGTYTIPPVTVNYFDSEKGQYRIISTEGHTVTVEPLSVQEGREPSLSQEENTAVKLQSREKRNVEFTGHDILPLKESLDGVKNRPNPSFSVFCMALTIPWLVLVCARIMRLYRNRDKKPSALMSYRADRALKEASQKNIGNDEFLALIYLAFVSVIFAKNNRTGENLTRRELRDIMVDAACHATDIEAAENLLDQIEAFRFSGRALDETLRRNLLEDIRKMAKRIE